MNKINKNSILHLILNSVQVTCYVAMIGIWIFVGWAIWKFGWGEFEHIFFPALGINAVFYGITVGIEKLKE